MAVSTTLRRPEFNRRLYGTVNLTLNSRTGVAPGMRLLIAGDTTVLVMRELANLVFACEVVGMPRGKARILFKPNDTVGNAPAPVIRSMSPASAVHNVAVQVVIYGTGFDAGASVFVGATQLTPSAVYPDAIIVVTFTAASIVAAGTSLVKVQNSDAQQSATANFTVT